MKYAGSSLLGVRLSAHIASVTAGLMWQPEMWPKR